MFRQGDQVVERGSMSCVGSVVAGPEWHGGEPYYCVNFNGRVKNIVEEDLEIYVGDQDAESLLRAGKFGDHIAFARRLTMSKLRRPLRDTVYSYKASRTDFHAYQFKPLLKFLSSDRRRLLIADEVGLGKTIEAGYVLQEERARFNIQRVLVVCPASLRTKWQSELWRRFGEEFEVLDRQTFQRKLVLRDGQGERGLPRLQGIVSLQSLRSNSVIEAVEQRGTQIDLLIVDEAHHCRNSETKQHRIVRALSFISDASLLLTAPTASGSTSQQTPSPTTVDPLGHENSHEPRVGASHKCARTQGTRVPATARRFPAGFGVTEFAGDVQLGKSSVRAQVMPWK